MGKSQLECNYPTQFDNNGINTGDRTTIANTFNKYFTCIGPELAKHIETPPGISVLDYMGKLNEHSMFLTPTDKEEVICTVNSCGNKYLTDCDDITMSLVKNVIEHISEPMTHIQVCNLSFKCGVFPHKMKTAKLIPLYKSGEKHLFINYRPISLLPQFSKILEKLFNSRLESFMNSFTILNSCQCVFREGMSTLHALVELLDDITHSLGYKTCPIGVFIDLKKAVDTVHHHQLLCKKTLTLWHLWKCI